MIRHLGPISGIAAFGGKFVATAGYDNQVILWDPRAAPRSAVPTTTTSPTRWPSAPTGAIW